MAMQQQQRRALPANHGMDANVPALHVAMFEPLESFQHGLPPFLFKDLRGPLRAKAV
jgi:hypothetical protein